MKQKKTKKVIPKKNDLPEGTVTVIVNNGKVTNAIANLKGFPTSGRYVVELTPTTITEGSEYAKKGSEQKRMLMLPAVGQVWDFSDGVVNPFYNSAARDK
jgi:hypothetical protein